MRALMIDQRAATFRRNILQKLRVPAPQNREWLEREASPDHHRTPVAEISLRSGQQPVRREELVLRILRTGLIHGRREQRAIDVMAPLLCVSADREQRNQQRTASHSPLWLQSCCLRYDLPLDVTPRPCHRLARRRRCPSDGNLRAEVRTNAAWRFRRPVDLVGLSSAAPRRGMGSVSLHRWWRSLRVPNHASSQPQFAQRNLGGSERRYA